MQAVVWPQLAVFLHTKHSMLSCGSSSAYVAMATVGYKPAWGSVADHMLSLLLAYHFEVIHHLIMLCYPCAGILNNLDYNLLECQGLVLAPTRELAQQIEKVMRALGDYLQVCGVQGFRATQQGLVLCWVQWAVSWRSRLRKSCAWATTCRWGGGVSKGRCSRVVGTGYQHVH
jgi:hypothetical protein